MAFQLKRAVLLQLLPRACRQESEAVCTRCHQCVGFPVSRSVSGVAFTLHLWAGGRAWGTPLLV